MPTELWKRNRGDRREAYTVIDRVPYKPDREIGFVVYIPGTAKVPAGWEALYRVGTGYRSLGTARGPGARQEAITAVEQDRPIPKQEARV